MEHLDNTEQEYRSIDSSLEPNASTFDPSAKEKTDRLFKRGRLWLALGVFLMGSSFTINYLLFDSNSSFIVVMYVLTSLGALCIMKCLADILGF